jgi:hypothetical protein
MSSTYDQCMLYNVFKATEAYLEHTAKSKKKRAGKNDLEASDGFLNHSSTALLEEFHGLLLSFRQRICDDRNKAEMKRIIEIYENLYHYKMN